MSLYILLKNCEILKISIAEAKRPFSKSNFEFLQLVFYGKTMKYQQICLEFKHWNLTKDFE